MRSLSVTQQNTILSQLDAGHSIRSIASATGFSTATISMLHSKECSDLQKSTGGLLMPTKIGLWRTGSRWYGLMRPQSTTWGQMVTNRLGKSQERGLVTDWYRRLSSLVEILWWYGAVWPGKELAMLLPVVWLAAECAVRILWCALCLIQVI